MNYKVAQNNLLNNGKGLTTRRRSIYMANKHQIDNTVFQGNISATVNQGEISATQGEISAKKKKKTKTMDINEAHYNMGHMGKVALRKLLNHHNIKQQANSRLHQLHEMESTEQES
jgi:predicted solute-binding protein